MSLHQRINCSSSSVKLVMATGNTCNICLIGETSQCEKASGKVPVSFAPNEKEINGRPDGTLGGVAASQEAGFRTDRVRDSIQALLA